MQTSPRLEARGFIPSPLALDERPQVPVVDPVEEASPSVPPNLRATSELDRDFLGLQSKQTGVAVGVHPKSRRSC